MRAFAFVIVLLAPGLALAQSPAHPVRTAPSVSPPSHPVRTTPAPAPAPKTPSAGHAKPKSPPPRHAPPPPPAPAPVPAPEPPKPTEPQKGSATGLPVPRFASLRSDEVNFRSGPGDRYPIEWVYQRRDLPIEIEREFEQWRLVEDFDGVKGWVHQATITARRTAVVIGGEQALRDAADDKASIVATLKPGLVVRLRTCAAGSDWCEAQAGDYRGYLKRSQIWGTLPGEVIP